MKLSLGLLPIFAICAITAPVSAAGTHIVTHGTPSVAALITELIIEVKHLTAHINQTLDFLPVNANATQKSVAAESVDKDLQSIANAFRTTNARVNSAAKHTKPDSVFRDVHDQLDGQPIDLAQLILSLLQELNSTLQSMLNTLSLGDIYLALQPLLTNELPNLITSLTRVISGLSTALPPLLAGVGSLLTPILSGLGF